MYKLSKNLTNALEGALMTGIAGAVAAGSSTNPNDLQTATAAAVSGLVGFAIAFLKNWLKNRGKQ